jgi:hypothetical protein
VRWVWTMAVLASFGSAAPARCQQSPGGPASTLAPRSEHPVDRSQAPQQNPGPSGQTALQQPQLKKRPAPKDDRLFWALPNYLTVENEEKTPALTASQKFRLEARQSFDPIQFPFIGFLALISQAEDSEPAFGQGMAGYGKRYAAAFGDATIGSFMTAGLLPAVLRQDPRYFQLGEGNFLHRAGYSLSRTFVTRSDSGRPQFNTSEIGGNLVAAGIANAYHPREDRTLANTLSIWGTDIGWDTVTNVAKEFWPDIRHVLSRGKR